MKGYSSTPAELDRQQDRRRLVSESAQHARTVTGDPAAKVTRAVRDGIEIKEGRHGRGVFATRAFAKGDAVESCPTLEVHGDDVSGRLGDYVFGSPESEDYVVLRSATGCSTTTPTRPTASTSRTARE